MDKKTKTIVAVVLAVVVIGGLSYGINSWNQQRLANQFLKEAYGLNSGGLFGGLMGGGSSGLSDQMVKQIADEAAKEEAQQKTDEEREAAKTPEDRYNETESVSLTGQTSSLVKEVVEPPFTSVFGKIKPTLFSGGYMGQEGSFLVVFKVPKVPTSEDFNKLSEEFVNNGFTVAMNSVSAESSYLLLEKDGATLSITYENPEDQEVGVIYYVE